MLLGKAHQADRPAEAAKFLKQAVDCTNDPTNAYIGLLQCVGHDEILDICRKILKCAPDKYALVYPRLETAAMITKYQNQCIELIVADIEGINDEARVVLAYKSLLKIFLDMTPVPERWHQIYTKTLEHVLKDSSAQNHQQITRKYVKLLYTQKKFADVLSKCIELLSFYPNEAVLAEIICKVYADTFEVADFDFDALVPNGVVVYAEQLLTVSPTSAPALFAKGLRQFSIGNFVDARDILNNVNHISKLNVLCIRMLAKTHYKLGAFTLAEHFYSHVNCVSVELISSLVEQKSKKKCERVLELAGQLKDSDDADRIVLLEAVTKANILLNQPANVEDIITQITKDGHEETAITLRAFRHLHNGENSEARAVLQGINICGSKAHLLLAQCHFAEHQYNEALSSALMATKMDQYNSNCYFWLGQIYNAYGDTERSRKCFEKSVFLNPQHEQSVILLSTIYRQLAEWELNFSILQKAAQAIPNMSCMWATLQLGFHNLSQNEFEEAISAFRTCLRLDPNDLRSWEGLADSYLKRGSYTSAMKIYQKICELTNNRFHPRFQVANLKSTLRYYNDAITCYEELLNEAPNDVPTLKGIADAHLCLAHQCFDHVKWLGRTKYHVNEAVKHLIVAIQVKSNFICLWRLLANCFELAACLPSAAAELNVPGALVNEPGDIITLKGEQLYEYASKFYSRALKISPSDEYIWYELAANYYQRVLRYGNETTKKKYLELAAEAAKHVIKQSPRHWKYWNLLGVICTTEEINNPQLAQHCFIKALEVEKKSAVVWTNLGVFYLSKGIQNVTLANAAFTHAQQSEFSYSSAWTGQAIIAELVDSIENIDLLTHSLSLSYSDEAAMRYAYWVCTYLNGAGRDGSFTSRMEEDHLRYVIENMHAVPTALDSMTWYCQSKGDEVTSEALTFLGFLHFKQQHWSNAIKAFNQALEKITTTQDRDKLYCNVAYCYLKNNEPLEAITAFNSVAEATFHSSVGLALAFFKAKQYESSYQTYQSTLECLARNDSEKSLILVAIASMVYVFQGENDAKSVLFQCLGLPEPPVEALLSACSLGLLHDDLEMAQLVLKELNNYERHPKWSEHVVFLRAQLYLKLDGSKRALTYLYTQIHCYPERPQLRKLLATFLLQNEKNEKYFMTAKIMIEATIALQRKDITCKMSSLDVAKLLALASEATRCANQRMSLKLAQKAIHINPTCKEAWAARAAISV